MSLAGADELICFKWSKSAAGAARAWRWKKKDEDGNLFYVDGEGKLRWCEPSENRQHVDDGGLDLGRVKQIDQVGATITLVEAGRHRFSSLNIYKLQAVSASAAEVESFAEKLRRAKERRLRGAPVGVSTLEPVEVRELGDFLLIQRADHHGSNPVEIRLPKCKHPLERDARFVRHWRNSKEGHGSEMGEVWIKVDTDRAHDTWDKFRTGSKALQFKGLDTGRFELELWHEDTHAPTMKELLKLVRSQEPLILSFDVKSVTVRQRIVEFMTQHMRHVIPRDLHQTKHGPGLIGVRSWCAHPERSGSRSA